MKISQCSHIRIRDTNEYGIDVEKYIKSIEKQFKIDFKSLPQWKELIKQLHAATTDCKRIIQASKNRKVHIIDKIYTEITKPSPFDLTDDLVRTAKIWENLESRRKKQEVTIQFVSEENQSDTGKYDEITGELSRTILTAHPNTEIVASDNHTELPLLSEVDTEANDIETSHLPISICTNQHKLLTPITSKLSSLNLKPVVDELKTTPIIDEPKEWLLLNKNVSIKCVPNEIKVSNAHLKEQSIYFSLLNSTTQYFYIRFKGVTDMTSFRKLKILPVTVKLYPGIKVVFKLTFKLSQTENFASSLYFKVGGSVLLANPAEALLVPITSNFMTLRSLCVSRTVTIAPAYSWHVNKQGGFPTGTVKVWNKNNCSYRLHVIKRLYDFTKELSNSLASVDVIGPNTESILQRTADNDVESQSQMFSPSEDIIKTVTEVESIKSIDVIALLVAETVEKALEPFLFETTYLNIYPHSKLEIPVYFTKAEHIGYHQSYYDFEFFEPDTAELIFTKTTRIFAEVLPHPVQVFPEILDMSNSPVCHGFCEDNFVITNTHNMCSVTVKIKLTRKMNKLFHISPMEVTMPPKSKLKFSVQLCSRSFASENNTQDYAHFTIKIIFSGCESVYANVPPFFFEIIAPCASDFKKIYSEKFFKEASDSYLQENSSALVERTS